MRRKARSGQAREEVGLLLDRWGVQGKGIYI